MSCKSSDDCGNAKFCNEATSKCEQCGMYCNKCITGRICGDCTSNVIANNIGICQKKCKTSPKNGQYCDNGKVRTCKDGLSQRCVCGSAKNCASCNKDYSGCKACLPGFKMKDGICDGECEDGFYSYGKRCLINIGTCNSQRNGCITDTFCPAEDITIVDCKKCGNSIKIDQGCNCVDGNISVNCLKCASGQCSKCINGFGLKSKDDCQPCKDSNCSECNSSLDCQNCYPGFYLDNKKCIKCSLSNCKECNDAVTCVVCDENFAVVKNKCVSLSCSITSGCIISSMFCDLTTQLCEPCDENCTACPSLFVCGSCIDGKQLNKFGVCENSCDPVPSNGQYCDNGVIYDCLPGLTSQCKCEHAENCSSCNEDKDKCETCIPGFNMDDSGVCTGCSDGYEQYETLCLVVKVVNGKCNSVSNSCYAGTFCPATDVTETDCKKCDNTIGIGQGCNCQADISTPNCQLCVFGSCYICIPGYALNDSKTCESCMIGCSDCTSPSVCTTCKSGFFLDNTECQPCGNNCATCSDEIICFACAQNFKLVEGLCIQMCNAELPCARSSDFCDSASMTCKSCPDGCLKCRNIEICGYCEADKQLNIHGTCETICSEKLIKDGNYCNNGVVDSCGQGITSGCQCGGSDNCASCNEHNDKCDTCLPGFKKDDEGVCIQCSEGYETYETLCLKVADIALISKKLPVWSIVVIIISIIVVVGVVIGGIVYYFFKKQKLIQLEMANNKLDNNDNQSGNNDNKPDNTHNQPKKAGKVLLGPIQAVSQQRPYLSPIKPSIIPDFDETLINNDSKILQVQ